MYIFLLPSPIPCAPPQIPRTPIEGPAAAAMALEARAQAIPPCTSLHNPSSSS